MKRFFFLTVYLYIFLFSTFGQTVHAIIACDDTDPVLGKAAGQDFSRISDFSHLIAEATGYKLNLIGLRGKDFTKDKVGATVRNLYPGSEDIVIFYYSGIGFRMAGKKSWSPYMLFPGDQKVDGEAVFRDLTARTAGTLLMIIEAGNLEYDADTVRRLSKSIPSAHTMERIKKLFLEKKYYIFQTAAAPGETSLAFPDGSAMTTLFVESFLKSMELPSPSWESILESTKERLSTDTASQQISRFFAVDHSPTTLISALNPPPKTESHKLSQGNPPQKPETPSLPQVMPAPVSQTLFGEPSSSYAGSLVSNQGFTPNIFSFNGGMLFEGAKSTWFLVFDSEPKPIILKRIALESNRYVFRSPNGSIVTVEPLAKKATLSIRKLGGGDATPLFSGEWRVSIVRYAL